MWSKESKIRIVRGDITKLKVDAIVNAANSTLLGGGGVDGAIHRAAGPELVKECRSISDSDNRCPTGEAVLTKGYHLPARYVIHTVGPVWHGGQYGEPELLKNCYVNALKRAVENQLATVAFPSISTGVYGYPVELAAPIAYRTVVTFLKENKSIEEVIFVCFSDHVYEVYQKLQEQQSLG